LVAAAEQQLRERGYSAMSLESIAKAAGTTVPSLLRRYPDKAALATAVVDSLRIEPMPTARDRPRQRALAILKNFHTNLRRDNSMALLGSLLAEEQRVPQLLERFRARLSTPRRQALREALGEGVKQGELAAEVDLDVAVNMLIGSFYARCIADGAIPRNWPERVLAQIWP
jgi:AcrR family transcriptional regulator